MKRPPRPEELALWARVAETVKPLPGRKVVKAEAKVVEPAALPPKKPAKAVPAPAAKVAKPKPAPEPFEPNRSRRVVKEREPITARVDLHGHTLERAREVLERFVFVSVERGDRLVLVITGKGDGGRETLKAMTPMWLSTPPLRALVAGVQPADKRHGGDGALYVALKRGR
jgi:DNA-nicking Smr family endonuclease